MTCVPFRVDGVDKRAKGICSEHVSRYWAEICAAEGCSRLIDTGGWPDRLSSSLLGRPVEERGGYRSAWQPMSGHG